MKIKKAKPAEPVVIDKPTRLWEAGQKQSVLLGILTDLVQQEAATNQYLCDAQDRNLNRCSRQVSGPRTEHIGPHMSLGFDNVEVVSIWEGDFCG